MTPGRVLAAGASALFAVLLVSGCGPTSHTAQPSVTSAPSQSSRTTTAGTVTSASENAGAGSAQGQSSEIAAIEQDVSQANSANSQVLTDLSAAAAAQAQNDSP